MNVGFYCCLQGLYQLPTDQWVWYKCKSCEFTYTFRKLLFPFFFFGLLPSLPWRNPSLASTFAKSFGLQDALREFSWEEDEFSQNCTFSALACTDLNKGQSSQYSDCLSFPLLWNLDLLLIYNCSNYNYLRFNSNNDNNDVEMASTQEKNPSFR